MRKQNDLDARRHPKSLIAHLLATLGWTTAGFTAIALASLALTHSPLHPIADVGFWAALPCVGGAIVAACIIAWIAWKTPREHIVRAHVLLWITTALFGWLVHVFAAAIDFGQTPGTTSALGTVAGAAAATGGALIIALGLAVVIGMDAPWRHWARSAAIVALTAWAVEAAAPDLLWFGVVFGIGLARAVTAITRNIAHTREIPAPALAACIVAGVSALALLIAYLLVRDAIRTFAGATAHGIETSAKRW